MVKYSKECKEQALLLSDDIGVKKRSRAAVAQLFDAGREEKDEKAQSKRRTHSIGQTAVERAGACHAARNTGGEKSEVYS